MGKEFNNTLSNFIKDFADGGAIRHLADLGYTVSEIMPQLDYPIPKESVAKIVWEHYINTGIISLEEPKASIEKISYIKEQNEYGKSSFRRVIEHIDTKEIKYKKVDFGKRIYQNPQAFNESLDKLSMSDKNYVLDLPWPNSDVYHIENDRIKRILEALQ